MHKLYRNDRALQLLLLAFMVVFYGGILLAGPLPHPSPPLNLTFNSMAANLLHGRFDVDPATIGYEGFLRNGHVYAYWGIFCALLRIPLVLLHHTGTDITLWSLLAAVCLSGTMLVRTLVLLRRHLPRTPRRRPRLRAPAPMHPLCRQPTRLPPHQYLSGDRVLGRRLRHGLRLLRCPRPPHTL